MQVIAVSAEQHLDHLVQVGQGGSDGSRTRRQIGGRKPASETFSSATWSMLRGAPEAANSATACASAMTSG
ncbi:MAG: hypothetical protein ACRDOL_18470 [Streptosporangiaceae bacterium]